MMSVTVEKSEPNSGTIRDLFTGADSAKEYEKFVREKAKVLYRDYPSDYVNNVITQAKKAGHLMPESDFNSDRLFHWTYSDVQVLRSAITTIIINEGDHQ